MFKVELTLPTTQHNGTSNLPTITTIKKTISVLYGGFTRTIVDGGWFDQETGTLYEDNSEQVSTLVQSEREVEQILDLSTAWAVELQQIELLVTITPNVRAEFVKGTREQAA